MPGLMGHLLGLERSELTRLAAAWGLPPDRASAADVYAQMTDAFGVAATGEALSGPARLLLDAIASQRRHTLSFAEAPSQLPLRDPDLRTAFAELEAFGLVVVRAQPGGQVAMVPDEIAACLGALTRLSTAADPSSTPLRVLLAELPHGELQRLAVRWNLESVETRLRRELLGDLEKTLSSREKAREAAARLSLPARRALTAVVRSGGRMEMAELRRKQGLDELALRAIVHELAEVFFIRQAYAGGRRAVFVPLGVGTFDLGPPETPVTELHAVDGPSLPPPTYPLLWDLLTVLAFIPEGRGRRVRLPLSAAQQRHLVPLFRDQDTQVSALRLPFLLALARGLDLLVEEDGRPALGQRVASWEGTDFPEQAMAAFRWWLGTERWREGLSQGERDTGGPLALPQGRERLVALLSECEPGAWYDLANFGALAKAKSPLLFRDREALSVAGGQAALERAARYWERWEGKVLNGALTLSLRWLGATAVADIEEKRCFAVTPLGAWLLGRPGAEAPERPRGHPLRLRADGDLEVCWAHGPTVAALLRFARPLPGADPIYRVDKDSVSIAIASGQSADSVLDALRAGGVTDQGIAEQIRQWAARIAHLRVRRSLLLEAETSAGLASLLENPAYARLRLRRLGPTAALVGDEEEFVRAEGRLRRDGYLVGSGDGT